MRFKHPIYQGMFAALAFCFLLGSVAVRADIPGEHPRYLHALADLQQTHRLLQITDEGTVWADQQQADLQVMKAIDDCHRAAIRDDKDLDWTPSADARQRPGRLREANRLLHEAMANLTENVEDNADAADWQQLAIEHVNSALTYTHQAMMDARIDAGE